MGWWKSGVSRHFVVRWNQAALPNLQASGQTRLPLGAGFRWKADAKGAVLPPVGIIAGF
jgi:hypothetical protein